jgi:hypothetical protein
MSERLHDPAFFQARRLKLAGESALFLNYAAPLSIIQFSVYFPFATLPLGATSFPRPALAPVGFSFGPPLLFMAGDEFADVGVEGVSVDQIDKMPPISETP